MRITLSVPLAALLFFGQAMAAEDQKAGGSAKSLKEQKEKVSYSLGYDVGSTLRKGSVDLDLDVFTKAFRAGFAGDKGVMSAEEMRDVVRTHQKEKSAALALKNKEDGQAFLAVNAKKEGVMDRFKRGELKILVSTTVVEVGVDVPNAAVMVIEEAEHFGLAQLHQLRGCVGRGAAQSYCILVTSKLGEAARERIRTLVESSDGFYIAEMDLKLRGPGEFFGTKQAGLPALRIANILRDGDILEIARSEATGFVSNPPSRDELVNAVAYIRDHWQRRYGLVKVG